MLFAPFDRAMLYFFFTFHVFLLFLEAMSSLLMASKNSKKHEM